MYRRYIPLVAFFWVEENTHWDKRILFSSLQLTSFRPIIYLPMVFTDFEEIFSWYYLQSAVVRQLSSGLPTSWLYYIEDIPFPTRTYHLVSNAYRILKKL